MHTIGTNHKRIAGNCVKTCLESHSCFLVGAKPISLCDQKVRGGGELRQERCSPFGGWERKRLRGVGRHSSSP